MKPLFVGAAILSIIAIVITLFIQHQSKKPITTPVIVIGAGMSGISAARELNKKGVKNITILESRDRIGGRINTINNTNTLNTPIDLGASWIHGYHPNNPLVSLAKKFKSKLSETDIRSSYSIYNENYRPVSKQTLEKAYQHFDRFKQSLKKSPYSNVQQALSAFCKQHHLNQQQQINLRFLSFISIETEYANALSRLPTHYDVGESFSGKDRLMLNGYNELINHLASPLKKAIKFNQVVNEIDFRNPNKIIVSTRNGNTYTAPAVICTTPIGVLKKHQIKFIPELPQQTQEAIDHLNMFSFDKVVLTFPSIFWNRDEHKQFIGMTPNVSDYDDPQQPVWAAFLNYAYYTKKPILIAYTAGHSADVMESLTNNQIKASVMQTLRHIYGNQIPQPTHITVTRWGKDPSAFGSYTSLGLHALKNNQDIINLTKPVNNALFFAGEGTSIRYSTTVHGAYLSGIRAAQQALKSIKERHLKSK